VGAVRLPETVRVPDPPPFPSSFGSERLGLGSLVDPLRVAAPVGAVLATDGLVADRVEDALADLPRRLVGRLTERFEHFPDRLIAVLESELPVPVPLYDLPLRHRVLLVLQLLGERTELDAPGPAVVVGAHTDVSSDTGDERSADLCRGSSDGPSTRAASGGGWGSPATCRCRRIEA
jgi:hypothetical protein